MNQRRRRYLQLNNRYCVNTSSSVCNSVECFWQAIERLSCWYCTQVISHFCHCVCVQSNLNKTALVQHLECQSYSLYPCGGSCVCKYTRFPEITFAILIWVRLGYTDHLAINKNHYILKTC